MQANSGVFFCKQALAPTREANSRVTNSIFQYKNIYRMELCFKGVLLQISAFSSAYGQVFL